MESLRATGAAETAELQHEEHGTQRVGVARQVGSQSVGRLVVSPSLTALGEVVVGGGKQIAAADEFESSVADIDVEVASATQLATEDERSVSDPDPTTDDAVDEASASSDGPVGLALEQLTPVTTVAPFVASPTPGTLAGPTVTAPTTTTPRALSTTSTSSAPRVAAPVPTSPTAPVARLRPTTTTTTTTTTTSTTVAPARADDSRYTCLLYTSPSPRDRQKSRMPSSA